MSPHVNYNENDSYYAILPEVIVTTPAIEINNVSFSYGDAPVLDDVSFSIAPHSLCALVGPNGSGKSTLIKCITGLLSPSSGSITVRHTEEQKRGTGFGYVEQRQFVGNDFPISVREVVATGRVTGQRRWFRLTKSDHIAIDHAIESVGLSEHAHCSMSELSGGQQQRVLIAKAFAGEPDILILDEPIAGVDAASQNLFRDALTHIISEHSTTVLLVSHELSAVVDVLDQVVVLKNRVLFDDTPAALSADGISLGVHNHDLPMWLERLDDEESS